MREEHAGRLQSAARNDSIAPTALGLVKRTIGGEEHILQRSVDAVCVKDADTGGHLEVWFVVGIAQPKALKIRSNALGNNQAIWLANIRQEDHKLFAAQAPKEVGLAQA